MAKQSFISHVVNGYSRYDVPESKAFTMTPGILYPVRIDFINARDRVSIAQGIDVRSNPLAVPSFNPYTVRLHRFWVPMQLYHPEMRTNSSKFDMNNLSLNFIPALIVDRPTLAGPVGRSAYSNSLFSWLRVFNGTTIQASTPLLPVETALTAAQLENRGSWANADSYLAYWDIVRNYYSYSQWGIYSFAWPASWALRGSGITSDGLGALNAIDYNTAARFFTQRFGNLEFLDAFYESQFYPSALESSNGTYNRSNLFSVICYSDLQTPGSASSSGYPVSTTYASLGDASTTTGGPASQFATSGTAQVTSLDLFYFAHPMAVIPSNPDRFSRLLPNGSSDAVSMTGVSTIPQLAIASRLQEYKDLLGAGGSRFSDWLETFFASKIEHVDRPKLLFSSSQTVNVQVVMNQSGTNNFQSEDGNGFPLGQQGGAIAFNSQLGRTQSYYFREPGYLIDMLSIRPVYYWSGIHPDYLSYLGSDYFNPVYNDIGYQDVSALNFGSSSNTASACEPCFNEFRSSYDEVLGQLAPFAGITNDSSAPLYSYWIQQRTSTLLQTSYYPALFVDITQVNSSFVSHTEDNFFVNMSYSVRKKNLVNKTFATRLSNR
nr:MAG TPA: Major capsid protein [Microviridae sp.]